MDKYEITVRPITPDELDHIVLRCWPEDRAVLARLFDEQGTIGMAAWVGDRCVGLLHCYRLLLPDGRNDHWPAWNDWWSNGWGKMALAEAGLVIRGPVWCHACFHVGRTLAAASTSDDPDADYFGRGIGTALCQASVAWARAHDYIAVLASGMPENLFAFALWAGGLPWTTYARLGFKSITKPDAQAGLPARAQGDSPPTVMAEVQAALAAERPIEAFHERLMVYELMLFHVTDPDFWYAITMSLRAPAKQSPRSGAEIASSAPLPRNDSLKSRSVL